MEKWLIPLFNYIHLICVLGFFHGGCGAFSKVSSYIGKTVETQASDIMDYFYEYIYMHWNITSLNILKINLQQSTFIFINISF